MNNATSAVQSQYAPLFGPQRKTDITNTVVPGSTDSTTSGPFANLGLSATQTAQVDSILSNAKTQGLSFSQVEKQIESVLSPTQQSSLLTDLQQLQAGHHHQGGSSGGSSTGNGVDSGTDAFGVSNAGSTSPSTPGSMFSSPTSADDSAVANSSDPLSLLNQIMAPTSQASMQSLAAYNPFSSIGSSYAVQSQLALQNLQ